MTGSREKTVKKEAIRKEEIPKMRFRKKGITHKVTSLLLTAVCGAVLLTGSISIWNLMTMKRVSTETSRELGQTAAEDAETALEKLAGEQLQTLAQEKAAYINENFAAVEASVHGIASMAEMIYENPAQYPDRTVEYPRKDSNELAVQLLQSQRLGSPTEAEKEELLKLGNIQDILVQYNAQNDMISSTYLATVSGWMLQADYIASSKYKNGGDIPDAYEADTRQWYQRALLQEQGQTVYSDVIRDAHGRGDCIVCSQPVYINGEIVAVAGIGSYLDTVNHAVLNTTIGETGYAFLVNQDGKVVVSLKKEGETAAYAEQDISLHNSSNTALALVATDMQAGNSGMTTLSLDGREVYLAYAPLSSLQWSFATVMPIEEVIAPAKESQQTILALTDQTATRQDGAIRQMLILLLIMVPAAVLAVSFVGAGFSKKITYPLYRLTADVEELSGGNLDYQIQIRTGDEVEELGRAFNRMTAQLKEYIRNLASVTAEKERIRTELQVASKLQADMLPDAESVLTGQKEFTLHAFMTPAKEVGGDFYDFYLLDDDHLALVVADVSGKGVPAALFMVVSRTLLRSSIAIQKPLAQTAWEVNNALCRNNKDDMFVTAWFGILTLSTGVLTYVNAGHCYPLLGREGTYTYLTERGGMMLSGLSDSDYQETRIQLQKGDILFQYSDGVIEAHNPDCTLYEEERLQNLLNQCSGEQPKELIQKVWEDLEVFRGTAEQFDDITMLAVWYQGTPTHKKQAAASELMDMGESTMMVCTPELEKLPEMTGHIELSLQGQLPHESMVSMLVAVDEIYSNICRYSHAGRVECTCHVEDAIVTLKFVDDGIPYNPLEKTDPDIETDPEDRDIGGLGIYLVKKQMDQVDYEYRDGRNCLTLIKKRADRQP